MNKEHEDFLIRTSGTVGCIQMTENELWRCSARYNTKHQEVKIIGEGTTPSEAIEDCKDQIKNLVEELNKVITEDKKEDNGYLKSSIPAAFSELFIQHHYKTGVRPRYVVLGERQWREYREWISTQPLYKREDNSYNPGPTMFEGVEIVRSSRDYWFETLS